MTPEIPPIGPGLPEPTPPPLAEPPAPPRWSLRDLGLFIGFGALAFAFAYLLVMAGFLVYRLVAPASALSQGSKGATFLALIFQMVFYLLLFVTIYALVALRGRLPFWKALKWKRPTLQRALVFLSCGSILAVAVQYAPTIFPDRNQFPLQQFFTSPATAYAVGAFAVLIAPLMEEMVFRGVLFAVFEDVVGLRFAVIATAVLFAGMHIPEYWGAWNHVFLLLIVGLFFSFARGMTGSLAPSVFLHTAYNFCQLLMLFFASDYFRKIQGVLLR
jgi:membrane protease YdiL (CAAX protease family)